MRFCDRLKEIRQKVGMTQAEAAEAAGVAVPSYQRWEYGTFEPRVSELRKLAEAFGVRVSTLLGDEPEVITIKHGPLSLDIPAGSEGFDYLEAKLRELIGDCRAG